MLMTRELAGLKIASGRANFSAEAQEVRESDYPILSQPCEFREHYRRVVSAMRERAASFGALGSSFAPHSLAGRLFVCVCGLFPSSNTLAAADDDDDCSFNNQSRAKTGLN